MKSIFQLILVLFLSNSISLQAKYWQQEVNYNIKVKLNDVNHTLSAFEEITYINNSPDTLYHIYMHLWPNAYQDETELAKQLLENEKTELYFGEKKFQGKIDSLNFQVDNQPVKWGLMEGYPDIARILLTHQLLPGDSILISTPFRVKVPVGEVSRIGRIAEDIKTQEGEFIFEEKSYQITQWYPKPAVFDTIGWHRLPYLSQGEFYSEYGEFNVEITTPKNYTIAATGNLVDEKYTRTHKTFKFNQKNIHDFGWFVDNDWILEESSINLPYSGRKVITRSYYKRNNEYPWKGAVHYIDSAVYYYSLWIGEYPYDVCTAVDGGITAGGGMEYPTITVIGDSHNKPTLEEVIVHEVGHNWFYGILGSNERIDPWLDEGINSYYERRYFEEVKPNISTVDMIGGGLLNYFIKDSNAIPPQYHYHGLAYEAIASRNSDLALNLPAVEYSQLNYAGMVYAKSAVAFNYLEKYLGKEVFDICMKEYYKQWQFQHPTPDDLEAIFKAYSNKNLDWFFKDLVGTSYPIDYQINSAYFNDETQKFELDISNKGDIASPVVVSALRNNKVIRTVWYDGFNGRAILDFPYEEYDEIAIDYYHDIPELRRNNNRFRMYDILGTIEPLEASFFFNFDKNDKTQIFASPIIGYNTHDKYQVGFGFYNSIIKEKPFRFLIMPQYAFGTNKIVGYGKITYSRYPSNDFRKINISLSHRKQGLDFGAFGGSFEKSELEVDFIIRNKNDRSKVKSNLSARLSEISLEADRRNRSSKSYLTFQYNRTNKRVIHPYKLSLMAQNFGQNWKIQSELNYKLTVNKKLQGIDIRIFAGYFIENPNVGTERFRMTANNGTLLGSSDYSTILYNTHDYLFDQVMLGRFNNNTTDLATQQISKSDGGFKSGYNVGLSSSWLSSANLVIPTPLKFLSIYGDVGVTESLIDNYNDNLSASPFLYDFGLQLNIKKDYLEIYFPLMYSDLIENNYETNGITSYWSKIKFMFNMNKLYNIYQ